MYELNALGLGGAPPARSAVPKQTYDLNALGLGGAPPARSAVPNERLHPGAPRGVDVLGHVCVEPADDPFQALDAAVGPAAAAQVVAFFGESDHLHFGFADPPQLNEELLGLLDRTAQVLLAMDE